MAKPHIRKKTYSINPASRKSSKLGKFSLYFKQNAQVV